MVGIVRNEQYIVQVVERVASLLVRSKQPGSHYMLEKTFMTTPPEIISIIARMAGRSGFCL